jgi:xylulokinase
MRSAGVPVEQLVAIGGGARSPLWTQIISDVCNIRQLVAAEVPGAPLGAAFMAAKGIGLIDDWRALRDRWLRIDRVVEPDPVMVAHYGAYYAVYRQLYPATRDAMHALAELAERPVGASLVGQRG